MMRFSTALICTLNLQKYLYATPDKIYLIYYSKATFNSDEVQPQYVGYLLAFVKNIAGENKGLFGK